ncbi:MAG: rRNA maturation RNase YbeY [Phycisphaerae bacterium]|nr:rRNA maturation RNase YbeY [Phycisphaerae bacterium]
MDDDSPYDISVAFECDGRDIDESEIHRAVRATLRQENRPSATISVAVVSDAHIASLNEKYLNHSGPTDVLSFDLGDGDVDGEIVVSLDTARRESEARGHAVAAELLLYVIHGTLHLLGFDDQTEADARRMRAEQTRILTELGFSGIVDAEAS